jgi:hypothetical protein
MSAKILNFTQTVTLKSLVVDHQAFDATLRKMPAFGQGLFKTVDVTSSRVSMPVSAAPTGQSLQAS